MSFVRASLVICSTLFTICASAQVPLSTCSVDAKRNVTIGSGGCGPSVYVDQSFTGALAFGAITIAAGSTLSVPDRRSVQLDVYTIVVNGTLQIGSAAQPFGTANVANVATINFTGATIPNAIEGIVVNAGGSLLLYGKSGVAKGGANPQAPSWTYLSAPAGPPSQYGANLGVATPVGTNGATTLQLADAVDWQTGQWIVVGGTDFSPDGAEFVQIASVSCTSTCTVTLNAKTPLVNYHFGGAAPDSGNAAFNDGYSQNYGIDERAEVGLISRNIHLTATPPVQNGYCCGGEIRILQGFTKVAVQGVELEKFGKGQLASYPIHFHMDGAVAAGATLVDSNSIHHSYNKCVAIHATNGLTISNNVCARAVGHLFYMETGTEQNDHFVNNLGIGAMSNAFSIPAASTAALASFWAGDYKTNASGIASGFGNGYNGFNVPFTDSATITGAANTPSGFWITNPGEGNAYTGNSIGGCQDIGRAYWLLVDAARQYTPLGAFSKNRAHGCYNGFDTAFVIPPISSTAQNYTPHGKCLAGPGVGTNNCDVVTTLDQLTSTRNRNIGIWVRPGWYSITGARLATNRQGVSMVSSGGQEGSPPGIWSVLQNAIIAGISANNPNRFGPCPYPGQDGFGGSGGCYEPASAAIMGNGYITPNWNLFGYMFYDGPARLQNVRSVNFNTNLGSYLTASDSTFLNYFTSSNKMPCNVTVPFQSEGDAAMGWFQSNVNSYPPTQYVQDTTYYNVDFRHEVYTQDVEETCAPGGAGGAFMDGDKFTVIQDRDATLTGLHVINNGTAVSGVAPISLNNLPFLAGPGTADECLSTGLQDLALEGRPTSLISPYSYATLEFSALSDCGTTCANSNVLIFTKNQVDYSATYQFNDAYVSSTALNTVNCPAPGHACVALTGRNQQGIYEPKVMDGLGYTVSATQGMPSFVSLMYTDAPATATNPFNSIIGICYMNNISGTNVAPPASTFSVYKGHKSFGAVTSNPATLSPTYFTQLACNDLDNATCITPSNCASVCPSAPFLAGGTSTSTKTALPSVSSFADLTSATACPSGECYFYDATAGLLFLNVVQEEMNAGSANSSPLGTCGGSKPPVICADQSFYATPADGAELYTVVTNSSYTQGPSACTPYSGSSNYTQPYPSGLNQLAYANGTAITTSVQGLTGSFPHQGLTNAPAGFCPTNAPSTPDWPAAPASSIATAFTLSVPGGYTASLTTSSGQPVPTIQTSSSLQLLNPGQQYTLTGQQTGTSCSCTATLTITSSGFTANANNTCQTPTSATSTTIPIGAFTCQ